MTTWEAMKPLAIPSIIRIACLEAIRTHLEYTEPCMNFQKGRRSGRGKEGNVRRRRSERKTGGGVEKLALCRMASEERRKG